MRAPHSLLQMMGAGRFYLPEEVAEVVASYCRQSQAAFQAR